MRERVGHGEALSRGTARWGVVPWRVGRRPSRGPRPVRPVGPEAAVRPAEAPRPEGFREPFGAPIGRRPPVRPDGSAEPAGPRLLARPAAKRAGCGARSRWGRVLAGFAAVLASAAAVVALGLLAGIGEAASSPPAPAVVLAPAPVVVTAEPGETVWEVAERVAPHLSGPDRSALAERIVVDNALTSARLHPGQPLRVAVR